ncbi:uncharacterized protein LOC130777619 isoform X2 [Actinidia eriantha]|uniref:uncharacterized protein LOC130777619 isoform X2 n=1 Tax=Actinidia eriantha TaxID=165200 RepID=UPI002590D667|nr:uncharacterized protein LOC130777619 isoform X2 [Actinidia eriantha]
MHDCKLKIHQLVRYVKSEDRKRALRLLQYALVHEVLGIPFDEIIIQRTIEGKPYLVTERHLNTKSQMRSLFLFTAYLLVLFVTTGNEVTMADGCEIQISVERGLCDEVTCNAECKKNKGRFARGRCLISDTCFCRYPC